MANAENGYSLVSRLLHWAIGVLMLGLIWLGWYMVGLTYFDKWYNESLALHKALGMFVLTLAVIFLIWRRIVLSPPYLPALKQWERISATVMHSLLLTMLVALPITGYFISTSAGQPIDIFGWFEIPSIVVINNTARDVAIDLHYYFGYGTGLLACLHVAAALKHHFIDRDETLIRMLRRSSHSKW